MIAASRFKSNMSSLSHLRVALESVLKYKNDCPYFEYVNTVCAEALHLKTDSIERLLHCKAEVIILSIIITNAPNIRNELAQNNPVEITVELAERLNKMVEEYIEAGI